MAKQIVTREQWQNHFYERALKKQLEADVLANQYNSANWVFGREIKVYRMPGVGEDLMKYVVLGIKDMMREIGLQFSVSCPSRLNAPQEINEAVSRATKANGRLDPETLEQMLLQYQFRNPHQPKLHGNVIVVDRYLTEGDENWGNSVFTRGCMILAVPGARQKSLEFIRKVAKHEAGHLFGYQTHHDEVLKHNNIRGYDVPSDCAMNWKCSTAELCDVCRDALTYFWKGIEDNSGEKFVERKEGIYVPKKFA